MTEIRSSWFIDGEGRVTRLDAPEHYWLSPGPHCSACGEAGHNVRTCLLADTEMDLRGRGER